MNAIGSSFGQNKKKVSNILFSYVQLRKCNHITFCGYLLREPCSVPLHIMNSYFNGKTQLCLTTLYLCHIRWWLWLCGLWTHTRVTGIQYRFWCTYLCLVSFRVFIIITVITAFKLSQSCVALHQLQKYCQLNVVRKDILTKHLIFMIRIQLRQGLDQPPALVLCGLPQAEPVIGHISLVGVVHY